MRTVLQNRVAELERGAALEQRDDGHERRLAGGRQVERAIAEETLGPEEALTRYGPPEPAPGPETPAREFSPAALRMIGERLAWLREAGGDAGPVGLRELGALGAERPFRR